MNEVLLLVVLYAVAALLLTAEIFLPSHGVLTVVGLGFLIAAIAKTYAFGQTAGTTAVVATLIALPTFAFVAVKTFPKTRVGKLIAPPNPHYTKTDLGTDTSDLEPLVGKIGKAKTLLRPVGMCDFDGRRVQCVSRLGLIEANTTVQAVGIHGGDLEVVVTEDRATT